jgi:hypothetical protein
LAVGIVVIRRLQEFADDALEEATPDLAWCECRSNARSLTSWS